MKIEDYFAYQKQLSKSLRVFDQALEPLRQMNANIVAAQSVLDPMEQMRNAVAAVRTPPIPAILRLQNEMNAILAQLEQLQTTCPQVSNYEQFVVSEEVADAVDGVIPYLPEEVQEECRETIASRIRGFCGKHLTLEKIGIAVGLIGGFISIVNGCDEILTRHAQPQQQVIIVQESKLENSAIGQPGDKLNDGVNVLADRVDSTNHGIDSMGSE